MAQVIVTIKVMPTGIDVDLEKLEQDIKYAVNPDRINKEPVAFGLVALIVTTIVEDEGGQVDTLENKLRAINGVNDVEVTGVTRTL